MPFIRAILLNIGGRLGGGNYSKRDEFDRNKSGGWCSFIKPEWRLEILKTNKLDILIAAEYKIIVLLKSWLWEALRSAS
jgi:hypothetical protein